MKPNWISVGAFLGGLAVVTGAFGAHGLKERLTPDKLDLWHTAVLYHVLHALALVAYGLFDREARANLAGACFLAGICVFSGTVYALALGAPKWFGAITPIGGVLLIVGWLAFAWRARRTT
ncbi:MAG: DUF423 domain-containing protein [Planctomycetota bacterium]|nr:DUF423 domain-containing protein [Planctomycetota bacterium]